MHRIVVIKYFDAVTIYFLGLLYSSGSKNEADCTRQEKDIVSTQPIAASKSAEGPVQSSYGSVIQMLHTDVSLAAQTNQSASPVSKVSEELTDAATTATETTKEDETIKETQTSDSEVTDALAVKASTELTPAKVKEETEAQKTDALEKEDNEGEPKLIVQDAVAKGPEDEQHGAQVDTQKEVDEEDIEKRPAEADKNEDSAAMNIKKEAGEVTTEKEELKTPVEVLPAMDNLQTKELVQNNTTTDEVKGLLSHVDRVESNADTLLSETSSANPLVSLLEPSCEVEQTVLANEKSLADKVLENLEEQVVSNMSEITEDCLPPKTQETSEQEFSPAVNSTEETTVNYIENGQVDDLTGGDWKDENSAEVDVEPSHMGNQELMGEPPANNKW